MEQSLYCPDLGYYEQEQSPGRAGDFYTSVSVGPLFGRLLAREFSRRMHALSGPLQLVEAGGHDGRLAMDILSWIEETDSDLWPRLEYWFIEPSARRRAWQARTLARFADRLRWVSSPDDLLRESVAGVLFSNELIDAFPVTRLRWSRGRQEWREMGIGIAGDRFEWRELSHPTQPVVPLLADAGLTIPPELAAVLPDGFMLDLAPGATSWWKSAARALRCGVLLTIDYGFPAELFLHPTRCDGTLRAYRNHRFAPDVLDAPGRQDLTCHVNFTQLQMAGEAAGLITEPWQTQAQFLGRIAREMWINGQLPAPADVRQFQTLIHPEHLGHRFTVLVQSRDGE